MRIWNFAGCEIEGKHAQLWVGGKATRLPEGESKVLLALLRSTGHSCSKQDLSDLWDPPGSEESVKKAISQLRASLKRLGVAGDVILTVYGWGYKIAVPVEARDFTARSAWADLQRGAPAPWLPGWQLAEPLEPGSLCHVWQIDNGRTGTDRQVRVVKYALDKERRSRLRRELRAWEYLECALPSQRGFVRAFSSHLSTFPCYIEWEHGGTNLLAWAEQQRQQHGLKRETSLAVVASVAEALAQAHALGLVHNDLKPANILLSPAPGPAGGWLVKIADFGIASVVESNRLREFQLSDATLLPGTDAAGGTANYRAPESGAGVLPATERDIYALGVILFQLLCGDFQRTPGPGWEREIGDPLLQFDLDGACNLDPKRRPKAAKFAEQLRTLEDRRIADAVKAAERQSEAERLRTAEENDRRSQQRLAAELARRPLRRALVGALALLVVAISTAAAVQVHSLRRDRDKARLEAEQAKSLQKFFEGLFFDGDAPIHGTLTAHLLAERGVDKARLLQKEPGIHATLINTLGSWFQNLGDFPKAKQLLSQALEERRKTFGESSPQVADSLAQEAAMLDAQSKPSEAMLLAQRALAIQQAKIPKGDIETSRTENLIAEILTDEGKYNESAAKLQALIAREQKQANVLPDLSTAINNLSIDENYLGNLPRSIQLQEEAMRIDRSLVGDRHPDIADHLVSLANLHELTGEYARAAAEAREALSIDEEWLPPGHHELAAIRAQLGAALAHLPDSAVEARIQLETAMATLHKEPERSRTEGYALMALGGLDKDQNHMADAFAAYSDGLRIYRKLDSPSGPGLIVALNGVASSAKELQKWPTMEQAAGEAYRISAASLPVSNPRRLTATINQARALAHEHHVEQAVQLERQVLNCVSNNPADSWIRGIAISDLNEFTHTAKSSQRDRRTHGRPTVSQPGRMQTKRHI